MSSLYAESHSDTLVVFFVDVYSDAGSIPAVSTKLIQWSVAR